MQNIILRVSLESKKIPSLHAALNQYVQVPIASYILAQDTCNLILLPISGLMLAQDTTGTSIHSYLGIIFIYKQ